MKFSFKSTFSLIIIYIISGTGIGILMGISSSPVVSNVIVGIIALITTLNTFIINYKEDEVNDNVIRKIKFSSGIIMLLIVGMVVGSFIGIYTRETSFFTKKIEGANFTLNSTNEFFQACDEFKRLRPDDFFEKINSGYNEIPGLQKKYQEVKNLGMDKDKIEYEMRKYINENC